MATPKATTARRDNRAAALGIAAAVAVSVFLALLQGWTSLGVEGAGFCGARKKKEERKTRERAEAGFPTKQ